MAGGMCLRSTTVWVRIPSQVQVNSLKVDDNKIYGYLTQLVECHVEAMNVVGSIPTVATNTQKVFT